MKFHPAMPVFTARGVLLFGAWLLLFAHSPAVAELARMDFVHDVAPVLSRLGCNGSACHGKAEGQNGFKLSIFGNDPEADHFAIVKQARGRRVMFTAPGASLLLKKAIAEVPHTGGPRTREGSREYGVLRDWIAGGASFRIAGRSEVTALRMEPAREVMGFDQRRPLRVIASYSDGREDDVTWLAMFHSNNTGLAEADENGVVLTGAAVGQATVMARFGGQIATFQATIPRPGARAEFAENTGCNEIDPLVDANLRRMNLRPSVLADDPEFLRRAYLDIIGRIPTAAEARTFLAEASKDRRARLVETLLAAPEYAAFWALKWSDLLRVDRLALSPEEAFSYYSWIRRAVAANQPLDAFARELLAAEGPLKEQPAGYFYKVAKKSGDMAASASQVLLGVRITCAECHQHPYDRWTQRDYHGMRGFFEQIKYKKLPDGEALVAEGNPVINHPRTKEVVNPYALGTPMPEKVGDGDRRRVLAEWMTAPENPWFARNLANRLWAHFLGRGVIEPVDDLRSTNPPSNPELLDALTRQLIEQRFDAKALIRFITASRTYQLASQPNETNAGDEQNFSRALFRRLPAEVLMDAVCDVTGVPEKFTGVPLGARAVELWDSQQQHYFLKLFGRPARATACDCERATGASISQALHLMNSPALQSKLARADGRIARLASSIPNNERLIQELYLACFSRFPSADENAAAVAHLTARAEKRPQAVEDLAWSLLNSLEFVFNH